LTVKLAAGHDRRTSRLGSQVKQEARVKGKLLIAIVASAIVGFAQWQWVLPYCWMYIAVHDPISHWLIIHGVRGTLLYAVLFVHDTMINVFLCLPAALVLHRLSPHKPLTYLAIAVLTGFLWSDRWLFQHPLPSGVGYGIFIYGALLTLVMLPGASALIGLSDRRRATSP
jgi:hypothetical protein